MNSLDALKLSIHRWSLIIYALSLVFSFASIYFKVSDLMRYFEYSNMMFNILLVIGLVYKTKQVVSGKVTKCYKNKLIYLLDCWAGLCTSFLIEYIIYSFYLWLF